MSTTQLQFPVSAAAPKVFAALLDFNHYPQWSGLTEVKILVEPSATANGIVAMTIATNGLTDNLEVKVFCPDEFQLNWNLISAKLVTKLDIQFRVEVVNEHNCVVHYESDLNFANPLMNMMKKTLEAQLAQRLLSRLEDWVNRQ